MNEQSTSNRRQQASAAAEPSAAAAAGSPPGPFSAERLRAIADEVRRGFPRAMTASELVIIDVDPRHIHAFWYIPIAVAEQCRAGLGAEAADAPLVLRIIEADGAAAAKFDIEVLGLQGRYYVDIWSEARRYYAQIGYRRGDGSLALLAAAPAITLPPLGPAADKSWRLQRVAAPATTAVATSPTPAASPDDEAKTPIIASAGIPASAAAVAVAAGSAGAAAHRFPLPPGTPAEVQPSQPPLAEGAPAWTEPLPMAVTPAPPPETAVASGADAAARGDGGTELAGQPLPPIPAMSGDDLPDSRAAGTTAAPPLPPDVPGEDLPDARGDAPPAALTSAEVAMTKEPPPATFLWMDAAPVQQPFPLPPSEPGAYDPEHQQAAFGPAPFDAPAAPSPDAAATDAPPAADAHQPGGPEDTAEGPAPLPLENTLSLSSFALGRETVELEINAELHIFGRTLPGRELHLFGRKVTVHPDGSFSISRPLPNGALIVSALLAGNGHREE